MDDLFLMQRIYWVAVGVLLSGHPIVRELHTHCYRILLAIRFCFAFSVDVQALCPAFFCVCKFVFVMLRRNALFRRLCALLVFSKTDWDAFGRPASSTFSGN